MLILQKSLKMLCVSLEAEPGSYPKQHYCFLAAPPLSLHPFPSLVSEWLKGLPGAWKGPAGSCWVSPALCLYCSSLCLFISTLDSI